MESNSRWGQSGAGAPDAELHAAAAEVAGARAQSVAIAADGAVRVVLDVTGLGSGAATALETATVNRLRRAGAGAVRVVRTSGREAGPARPRRILAVASGKGGVGKSTVAANLAVALAARGLSVGLLDADIHGPSVPTLLGTRERAGLKEKRIQPVAAHGILALSMGMMSDPDRAVAWRGPMASSAMAQMVKETDWGPLDLLIIDMPPGTGDISITLAQQVKPDAVLIVSTPQDLALIDARRALSLFRTLGTPVIGLVENMSLFTCPRCGQPSAIFGAGGVEAAAAAEGLPLLARLPLDPAIRAASDAGVPAPGEPFAALAAAVTERLEEMADAA